MLLAKLSLDVQRFVVFKWRALTNLSNNNSKELVVNNKGEQKEKCSRIDTYKMRPLIEQQSINEIQLGLEGFGISPDWNEDSIKKHCPSGTWEAIQFYSTGEKGYEDAAKQFMKRALETMSSTFAEAAGL